MIRLTEIVKYRHIRPFTKVEMNQIADDYLRNNKFKARYLVRDYQENIRCILSTLEN